MFSFLYVLIWFELNYISIWLCKDPNFSSYLKLVYSLLTAISSVIENHRFIDAFVLPAERGKYILFNSLITRTILEGLPCLPSWLLSQSLRFRGIRSNVSRGIESEIVVLKVLERGRGRLPVHFMVWKLIESNKQ